MAQSAILPTHLQPNDGSTFQCVDGLKLCHSNAVDGECLNANIKTIKNVSRHWMTHNMLSVRATPSNMIRGQLVEIGVSHQIRWNILREHNWGVPSVHIKFIYYVTYIVQYLIMLCGHACTGMYTILKLHA